MNNYSGLTKTIFLPFLLFILSTALLAQNNIHKIENLLHTNYEQGRFNGSALVAYNGKVIFKKGFGLANMEWDIPNAADTKHRLGSITKQFTAMLILQLAAEGTVDLHTPITKYLPDYPSDNGDRVSIHHLLTHTSGIPNYTAFPGFFQEKSRNPYTPKEFVKEFWDLPLEFEPGTKFNYSNSAYFLLGVIIEELTGNSYQEELQKRILDPLGMKSSGYDLSGPILKNRASGYDKNGRLYRNTNYIDMSLPYAAGSMYSTVEDLFLWDRALYTTDLIPQKYMDLYFKSHTEGLGRRYAYGWSVGKIPLGTSQDSVYTIGHGGGINGFNTLITRAPSNESTVILLNNTGGTSLNEMAGSILAILNDKSYELPKKSLAYHLLDAIQQKGLSSGLKDFEKAKNDDTYELSENEMNSIGYQFLQHKKVEAAEAVFKINMKSFPNSSNVYDSYAESLMIQNKNEEAIKYYRKSIELNPANQNGIDMLVKLGVSKEEFEKKVDVSEKVLASYIGKYELMPNFIITITKNGKQLSAQATGQSAFDIFPSSEDRFYLKAIEAQIQFNKDDAGSVISLTLFQGGREMPGKKIAY